MYPGPKDKGTCKCLFTFGFHPAGVLEIYVYTCTMFSGNWIDMWSGKTINTKISPPGVPRPANLLPIALMMSESDPRFHSRFLNAVQFHFSTCNFHQVMMKTTFNGGYMYLQGDIGWFRSSVESFLSNSKFLAISELKHKESYSCIVCIFMTLFASWHMTFLPRLSGRHQIGKRGCWEYSHIFVHSPVLSELLCCNISQCG